MSRYRLSTRTSSSARISAFALAFLTAIGAIGNMDRFLAGMDQRYGK